MKGIDVKHAGTRTVVGLCAVALAVTAGCGTGGGGNGGGEDQLTVGMSVSTLNNPYFVDMRAGARQAAKAAGATLTVQDAQDSATAQADQLQNFITQGMSAIVVNPVDSKAAAVPVEEAGEANIPVVAADRSVSGAKTASTVASDNVKGGKLAAKTLAEAIGKSGKIAVLQGVPGTSAARARGQGFSQAIKDYSKIDVVARQPANFDRAEALNVMSNLLQAHPAIKGVFAQNDEMALGAVKALGGRAGGQVKVVGFDGTDDGLKAVKQGTMYATIAQQPEKLGKQSVRLAIKAAKGKNVPEEIKVPVKVVTRDNVDQFLGD